jgi:hypothetical protein
MVDDEVPVLCCSNTRMVVDKSSTVIEIAIPVLQSGRKAQLLTGIFDNAISRFMILCSVNILLYGNIVNNYF